MPDIDPNDPRLDLIRERQERRKATGLTRTIVIALQKVILSLAHHWYALAMLVAIGIFGLGLLAPTQMAFGSKAQGLASYQRLAPHDHQLPQRSYFLYSEAGGIQTYSLEEILAAGADGDNLRLFLGNDEMGYKLGFNHRMTAIFVAIILGGLLWKLAGERPKLGVVSLLLLLLPIFIDGFSHVISEQGAGFRASNAWAVALTGGAFSETFYTGSTLGTLNWLLRTVTGLLFGFGFVWGLFNYLSLRFEAIRARLEPRLREIGAIG